MGDHVPGPQGFGSSAWEKIDSGTLARTSTHMPGITSGGASEKQGISRTRPVKDLPWSSGEMTAKLGEIFFRTDEHVLDPDDKNVLNHLCADLRLLLKVGYRFDLLCEGNADHRASEAYNLTLGDRRADSVKAYILTQIRSAALRVLTRSEGESQAAQPGKRKLPVPDVRLAYDRRVDVPFLAVTPPVRIAMDGNWIHTSSLEKLELDSGGRIFAKDSKYVTVMIKTNYRLLTTPTGREASVDCTVTRVDTNAVLFAASANADADRVTMRKGYKVSPDSRVTRLLLPGSDPPHGAVFVNVKYRATNDQAGDLLQVIYDQLRGKHHNISERIQEALTPLGAAT